MALDRLLDLLAYRLLCFSFFLFLAVLVIPHVRQTKLASSRSTFLRHARTLID